MLKREASDRCPGYDTWAPDVANVFIAKPPGTVRTHTVAADLLLDAQGFLVGIDLEPDAQTRTVVMVGDHAKVARKVAVRVGVCTDGSGDVFEVRIAAARAAIRGNEKSPYV